jgi:hypothetical protein
MKLVLTLFACLAALATAAPALAGNGQSVTESIGTVQASSTNIAPAVAVAAPVAASAPVCVASACSTGQSTEPAGSAASTTSGGQSRPAGQRVSDSVGAVQLDSTNVSPAVSAAAPVGVFVPVCVASRCSAGQAVGQADSGSNSTGGDVQGETASPQTTQSPSAPPSASGAKQPGSRSTRSSGSGGAEGGAADRSAGNEPRSGLFAPTSGPHPRGSGRSAAGGQSGKEGHAAQSKGCVFSGVSAKLDGRPAAAGFVPAGGHSLTLLLAIACGLLAVSSFTQWVGSEARWWRG